MHPVRQYAVYTYHAYIPTYTYCLYISSTFHGAGIRFIPYLPTYGSNFVYSQLSLLTPDSVIRNPPPESCLALPCLALRWVTSNYPTRHNRPVYLSAGHLHCQLSFSQYAAMVSLTWNFAETGVARSFLMPDRQLHEWLNEWMLGLI